MKVRCPARPLPDKGAEERFNLGPKLRKLVEKIFRVVEDFPKEESETLPSFRPIISGDSVVCPQKRRPQELSGRTTKGKIV